MAREVFTRVKIGPLAKPRDCRICGRLFAPHRKWPKARHCTPRCIWQSTKGQKYNAAIARASIGRRAAAQRGVVRDKDRPYPYRKRMLRHEHRIVAERKLGRPLKRGEIVRILDRAKPVTTRNIEVYPSRSAFASAVFSRPQNVQHIEKRWASRRRNLLDRKSIS